MALEEFYNQMVYPTTYVTVITEHKNNATPPGISTSGGGGGGTGDLTATNNLLIELGKKIPNGLINFEFDAIEIDPVAAGQNGEGELGEARYFLDGTLVATINVTYDADGCISNVAKA